MVKRVAAICCLVIALSACEKTTTQSVSSMSGAAGVQLITLEDGTKCAVIVGYQKGGISCGWK